MYNTNAFILPLTYQLTSKLLNYFLQTVQNHTSISIYYNNEWCYFKVRQLFAIRSVRILLIITKLLVRRKLIKIWVALKSDFSNFAKRCRVEEYDVFEENLKLSFDKWNTCYFLDRFHRDKFDKIDPSVVKNRWKNRERKSMSRKVLGKCSLYLWRTRTISLINS